ncbi:hypothetical protein LCGC14_1494470 [marine sediment metagenome]|uniref:Uncharacterized protein n=1 Tax=marine sediment metagenome TaxID=412755 RepID=A0A0F9J6E2_9ZZZZ
MIVQRAENGTGSSVSIAFVAQDENLDQLRTNMMDWLKDNYPQMNLKQILERLQKWDSSSITLSMEGWPHGS